MKYLPVVPSVDDINPALTHSKECIKFPIRLGSLRSMQDLYHQQLHSKPYTALNPSPQTRLQGPPLGGTPTGGADLVKKPSNDCTC